jgi:manganese/zinc/iron transport system substrate-binding protein
MNRRDFLSFSLASLAIAPLAYAGGRAQVVATTGMIADTVRRIGGEHVDVTGLMGSGIDPHSYRQTRSDIVALARADLVFWNGLNLEAQLISLINKIAATKPVIAVGDAVPRDLIARHPSYANQPDPHVWMVPDLWRHAAVAVRDALSAQFPEGATEFATNYEAFDAEMTAVQSYGQEIISTIPKEKRILVTAHDAFGYFGRAFDFDVVGIQGISTASEAGLYRIQEVVNLLVERDIRAVFVETSVSDQTVKAVIDGAAAVGHSLSIAGQLFSDAMGPEGTYRGTYIGMLDHNYTTIAEALGGRVPKGGAFGKLIG